MSKSPVDVAKELAQLGYYDVLVTLQALAAADNGQLSVTELVHTMRKLSQSLKVTEHSILQMLRRDLIRHYGGNFKITSFGRKVANALSLPNPNEPLHCSICNENIKRIPSVKFQDEKIIFMCPKCVRKEEASKKTK